MTRLLQPIDGSTVLYLPFWEGVGTFTEDISAFKNHGTINGATWTDGIIGKALSFDNTNNSSVALPNNASLQVTRISIAMWINTSYLPSTIPEAFMRFFASAGDEMAFFYRKDSSSLSFKLTTTEGNQPRPLVAEINLFTNTWFFIVATYDGATANIYVNGILKSTVNRDNTDLIYTQPLVIGGENGATTYDYAGLIDEVKIFNRALSATEIFEEYYRGARGSY